MTWSQRDAGVDSRPSLYAFEVDRAERPPLLVLWDHRDAFSGEADPPVPVAWPWSAPTATASDALGDGQDVEVRDGRVELNVSLTPVFVTVSPERDQSVEISAP